MEVEFFTDDEVTAAFTEILLSELGDVKLAVSGALMLTRGLRDRRLAIVEVPVVEQDDPVTSDLQALSVAKAQAIREGRSDAAERIRTAELLLKARQESGT